MDAATLQRRADASRKRLSALYARRSLLAQNVLIAQNELARCLAEIAAADAEARLSEAQATAALLKAGGPTLCHSRFISG